MREIRIFWVGGAQQSRGLGEVWRFKDESNGGGGWLGEVLWHRSVLWPTTFVLVELCSAVRRAGDKVKQCRRCWPGSPLLSLLRSTGADGGDINIPCFVFVCVCTYFYLHKSVHTCMFPMCPPSYAWPTVQNAVELLYLLRARLTSS